MLVWSMILLLSLIAKMMLVKPGGGLRADTRSADRVRATHWSGISFISLHGGNPVPNAGASLVTSRYALKIKTSGGSRADARWTDRTSGHSLVRDFFYSPSMGEIPGQTRTLRSLFPIPPPSLPRSPSTAFKGHGLRFVGPFFALVASLVASRYALKIKTFGSSRADARWTDRALGRCWSGISSIPLQGGNPVPNAGASLPFPDSAPLAASLTLYCF
jgi:hypothetical protein